MLLPPDQNGKLKCRLEKIKCGKTADETFYRLG